METCTNLHYGLKVEAHSVPQGELPTARAGKKPATLRRPSYYVDRVFDLIQGGMEVLGRYSIGCTLGFRSRRKHLIHAIGASERNETRWISCIFACSSYIHRLYSLDSASPSPEVSLLCVVVGDSASIAPSKSHSQ